MHTLLFLIVAVQDPISQAPETDDPVAGVWRWAAIVSLTGLVALFGLFVWALKRTGEKEKKYGEILRDKDKLIFEKMEKMNEKYEARLTDVIKCVDGVQHGLEDNTAAVKELVGMQRGRP